MRILADDDTEFKTVEECKVYEEKVKKIKDSIKCFDIKNKKIVKQRIEYSEYILIINAGIELDKITEFINQQYGVPIKGISEINTLYKYIDDNTGWKSLGCLIEEKQKEIEELEDSLEIVERYFS